MGNKFELIAFDIDGTLTRSKSPLEDNPNVDTDMSDLLGELLEKYKVAIISGASLTQFKNQILAHLTQDGEKLKNLFLLPTNGSTLCVYEGSEWLCPAAEQLTDDEKSQIYEAFDKMFAEVGFTIPAHVYGEVIEDRGSQITFSAFGQMAPLEIKEAWDKDHHRREEMIMVLGKHLPDFASHIGGATSIDVTRKWIDKAYGLHKLLKYLNIDAKNLLYIGDELQPGGNDSPALTVAGECRAVTGPEDTKQVINELLKESVV